MIPEDSNPKTKLNRKDLQKILLSIEDPFLNTIGALMLTTSYRFAINTAIEAVSQAVNEDFKVNSNFHVIWKPNDLILVEYISSDNHYYLITFTQDFDNQTLVCSPLSPLALKLKNLRNS